MKKVFTVLFTILVMLASNNVYGYFSGTIEVTAEKEINTGEEIIVQIMLKDANRLEHAEFATTLVYDKNVLECLLPEESISESGWTVSAYKDIVFAYGELQEGDNNIIEIKFKPKDLEEKTVNIEFTELRVYDKDEISYYPNQTVSINIKEKLDENKEDNNTENNNDEKEDNNTENSNDKKDETGENNNTESNNDEKEDNNIENNNEEQKDNEQDEQKDNQEKDKENNNEEDSKENTDKKKEELNSEKQDESENNNNSENNSNLVEEAPKKDDTVQNRIDMYLFEENNQNIENTTLNNSTNIIKTTNKVNNYKTINQNKSEIINNKNIYNESKLKNEGKIETKGKTEENKIIEIPEEQNKLYNIIVEEYVKAPEKIEIQENTSKAQEKNNNILLVIFMIQNIIEIALIIEVIALEKNK